jgi:hypothetical protein
VRRPGLVCVLSALAFASCGDEPSLPRSCLDADADTVLQVLRGAPDRATLPDGTPLSACIDHAEDDGDLQTVALTFVAVADRLAGELPQNPRAAYQLGWLIGAAERGAGPTGGTQGELVQRLEQTASFREGAAQRRAGILRGIADGRRAG